MTKLNELLLQSNVIAVHYFLSDLVEYALVLINWCYIEYYINSYQFFFEGVLMEAKIFMSLAQLIRSLLGVFLLGIVFGAAIGGVLFLKFKKHSR